LETFVALVYTGRDKEEDDTIAMTFGFLRPPPMIVII